jgi:hypothetical protein
MTDNVPETQESHTVKTGGLAQKLDAASWGLFFVWVGIALLMEFSWGVGLLGVAVITLGGQAFRRYFGLSLEWFWVVAGVLFLAAAVWELLQVQIALVPIVLIVAGAALLVSLFGGTRQGSE